jgi:hypothetical protein
LKIPYTKRAGGVDQGVGSEFKPWYCKKEKTKQNKKKTKEKRGWEHGSSDRK